MRNKGCFIKKVNVYRMIEMIENIAFIEKEEWLEMLIESLDLEDEVLFVDE